MNGPDARVSSLSAKQLEILEQLRRGREFVTTAKSCQADKAIDISFEQESLWQRTHLSDQPGNNLVSLMELKGELNVSVFAKAVHLIIQRHETLRTSFHESENSLLVRISDGMDFGLDFVDLTSLPFDEAFDQVVHIGLQRTHEDFTISEPPLGYICLYKLDSATHLLMLIANHMVFDGWSFGVFAKELSIIYGDLKENLDPRLAPIQETYFALARRQRERMTPQRTERFFDFWSEFLERGFEPIQLQTDLPRVHPQGVAIKTLKLDLSRETVEALAEICRANRLTSFMGLLAAFSIVLSRRTGLSDLAIKSVLAGRSSPEAFGLIGMFSKMLIFRTRVEADITVRGFLADTRQMCTKVYANEEGPGAKTLFETLEARGVWTEKPHFAVSMLLQNYPAPQFTLPGISAREVLVSFGSGDEDIELCFVQSADALSVMASYNSALFLPGSVTDLVHDIEEVIGVMRELLDEPLSSFLN